MDNASIGLACLAAATVLIGLRFHIGLSLGLMSAIGLMGILGPNAALAVLKSAPFEFAASWELSAVPMFVLMGSMALHTGLANSLFDAARVWLGRVPGGLAVAANMASGGFSAVSGSSLATTITMGRLSIPVMRRFGYDPGLATGVIATAGTLGSLIPPSIPLLIYAVFAETSASKLFLAAIVPGLITVGIYTIMIVIRCAINPALAPAPDERFTLRQKLNATKNVWPLPLLVLIIMGSIYGGFATPTEAGALSVVVTVAITLAMRRLTLDIVRTSIMETVVTTAALFFIAFGAILMTRLMTYSGVPFYLSSFISSFELTQLQLILLIAAMYLILGCFIDPMGMTMLTLPVVLPLLKTAGIDLIWFGILMIKFVEIGLITPPLGLNVFAVNSLAPDVKTTVIFKGVTWFIVCEIIVVALLIAFPEIVLFPL